jgi:hypothetical protein
MNFAIRTLLPAVLLLTSLSAVNGATFTLDDLSLSWAFPSELLNDEPCIAAAALPMLGVRFGQMGLGPFDIIDGVSNGNDVIFGFEDPDDPGGVVDVPAVVPVFGWELGLLFSVDRQSVGAPMTGVRQEKVNDTAPPGGGPNNGHMADIFLFKGTLGQNELAPSPLGAPCGTRTGDESNRNLVLPGGGQPGDDLISFDRDTLRRNPALMGPPPFPVFFTLEPGSPALAALGVSPGDILAVGGGFGPVPVVFIPEGDLGIPAGSNVNAMALKVIPPTAAGGQAALDQILFSVDSASANGFIVDDGNAVVSGGEVLHFDGTDTIVAYDHNDLGLDDLDDLDALDTTKLSTFVVGAIPVFPWGDVEVVPGAAGVVVTTPGEDEDEGLGFEFDPSVRFGVDVTWPAATAPESMELVALGNIGGQEGEEITRLGIKPQSGEKSGQKDLLIPAVQIIADWANDTYVVRGVEIWAGNLRQATIAVELDAGTKTMKPVRRPHPWDWIYYDFAKPSPTVDVKPTCSLGKMANGLSTIDWTLAFPETGVFNIDGETYEGDRIRIRMGEGNDTIQVQEIWGLTGMALLTEGASTFGLSNVTTTPGSTLNGVPLLARGQAKTQRSSDGLHVNNITDSGEDGVSVKIGARVENDQSLYIGNDRNAVVDDSLSFDLFDISRSGMAGVPHAAVFSAYLDVQFVTGPHHDGVIVQVAAFGDAGVPLGSLGICNNGTTAPGVCFEAGSSVTKSTTHGLVHVILRLDGDIVHSFETEAGELCTIEGFSGDVIAGYGNDFLMPVEDVFSLNFAEPVRLHCGAHSIMAHEIVVLPAGSSDLDQVTEVALQATGIDSFVINAFAAFEQSSTTEPIFLRGDATATGAVDFTDAIVTLEVVLLGRGELTCLDAADSNDDGSADLTDAIVTLEEVFLGRIGIQAPGPFVCGADPTEDALGCEAYEACP